MNEMQISYKVFERVRYVLQWTVTSPVVPNRRQLHIICAGAVGAVGQTGLYHGG